MNKKLIQSTGVVLITKGVGGVSGLVAAILTTRLLGEDEAGSFFLVLVWVNILATVGRVGLDKTLLRYTSSYKALGQTQQINGVVTLYLIIGAVLSSVLGLMLVLFSGDAAGFILNRPELSPLIRIMAISIPCVAASCLIAGALQGLGRYSNSVFTLNISTNLWFIIAMFIMYLTGKKLVGSDAGMIFTIASVAAVAIGVYQLRNEIFSSSRIFPESELIVKSGVPLYLADVMSMLVLWGPQLMAGIWIESKEMAYLAAAQRAATLTSLLLLALNMVTAPRFSALYSLGKLEELKKLAQFSSAALTMIAVPIVILMCIFPAFFMSAFGDEFRNGAVILQILAFGQLINSMSGSVVYLMMMSGHERDLRNITVITGCLTILMSCIMTKLYGVVGAAISSSAALILLNGITMYYVKKRLGFWTISIASLRTFIADFKTMVRH